MKMKDTYPTLIEAVSTAAHLHGGRATSAEVLEVVLQMAPDLVNDLLQAGYGEPLDAVRKANRTWSWRQFLGNALARLSRRGEIRLLGHTSFVPAGYYGVVGIWAPATSTPTRATVAINVHVPARLKARALAAARQTGTTLTSLVTEALERYLSARTDDDSEGPVQAEPAVALGRILTRLEDHNGVHLQTLSDWEGIHPTRHWVDGRSAKLLAEACLRDGGVPERVLEALERCPEGDLVGLNIEVGIAEHPTTPPGRGRASTTDLMILATGASLALEAKVDEGFDASVDGWSAAGDSERSLKNRVVRLRGICAGLGLDPADVGDLRYQLLHRSWSAIHMATERDHTVAALVVHSFMDPTGHGSGFGDFVAFAAALRPATPAPVPGVPWFAGERSGVRFWLVWVSDVGGVPLA